MNFNYLKRTVLLPLLLVFSSSLFAQYTSRGEAFDYLDAESFVEQRNFYEALFLYTNLSKNYPKNQEYVLKMGICNIELNNALEAKKLILKSKVKKKEPTNYSFYLAKAYALNNQFDSAIILFNKALNKSSISSTFKDKIPNLIKQCENGIELVKNPIDVEIVNLGAPINTIANEYSAVVNANESVLVYAYRGEKSTGGRQNSLLEPQVNGHYFEDVFISYKKNGEWSNPKSISKKVNTNTHEAPVAMSPDGQIIYIYRNTKTKSGDLFYIQKQKNGWSDMIRLPINSSYWEGSMTVSPNGKTAIFSSDRPGGFGGLDLYISTKNKQGEWSKPKNLGNKINTEFDEDAPFIHSDGKVFNFSSKGHNSMGGFDIFESKILDEDFLEARNIGYPINTTANDIFFFVSGRGNAYYTSSRAGGIGQNDIYSIDVRDIIMKKSPVLLLQGTVSEPNSKIVVEDINGVNKGNYVSNAEDGSYLFYLPLGNQYKVSFTSPSGLKEMIDVDTRDKTKYEELTRNIMFIEEEPKEIKPEFDLAIPGNFILFEQTYGKTEVKDVVFQVQIGAYSSPENFKLKKWKRFGTINEEVGTDGITRFKIGDYKNFNQAKKVTERARKLGDKDAFVLVFYKGERTSLNKLIAKGVYTF